MSAAVQKTRRPAKGASIVPPPVRIPAWARLKEHVKSSEIEDASERLPVLLEALTLLKYTPDTRRDEGQVLTILRLLIKGTIELAQVDDFFEPCLVEAVSLLHEHLVQDCEYDLKETSLVPRGR